MNERRLQWSIVICSGIVLVIAIFWIIKNAWISADAPYYLSVARDLSEGKVLFKEIINNYTPLVMVLFSGVFIAIKHPPFTVIMMVHVFVILLSGSVLFLVLNHLKLSLLNALTLSAFFCLAILSADGNYFVLESYSIFFVLLALLTLLKNKSFFLVGVLLGCSFLCKQYGVLNFIPFFFYIFLRDEPFVSCIRKGSVLGLGGLSVFVIFVGYYTVFKSVDFMELLRQISGTEYSSVSIEKKRNLLSVLIGAKVFILFSSIPILYAIRGGKITRELKFSLFGVLICLLPVYLRGYQHYYINTFPYLFLGIGLILLVSEKSGSKKFYLGVLVAATTISTGLLFSRIVRYSGKGDIQREVASRISDHIPVGSPVYIQGELRYMYILNNYKNPYLSTIGYSYLFTDVDSLLKDQRQLILSSERYKDTVPTEIKTEWGSVFIYFPLR